MYSDFDGTLLRELEHIDSTVTVLSTFNNGGLEVLSPLFVKNLNQQLNFGLSNSPSIMKAQYSILI